MGRFERLVKTPALIELFKEKYHIPQEVSIQYCSTEEMTFDRKVGEVIIPMIAFIEGGMTVPMSRITKDYLRAHRLCPQQCAPNFFRVLGVIDALDRHLGLGLTWYDVAHLYEGHIEARAGFYLKSRSSVVKLISCLLKSDKGMKYNFLILSGPWSDGFPFPTKLGEPGGVTLDLGFLTLDLRSLISALLYCT